MLNLRQVGENLNNVHTDFDGYELAQRSTIRINANAIVGNMGELLDFGHQSHNDFLEDDMNQNNATYSGSSMLFGRLSIHQVDADKEVGKHNEMALRMTCVDIELVVLGYLCSMIYDTPSTLFWSLRK
jgi:hypothetical protein